MARSWRSFSVLTLLLAAVVPSLSGGAALANSTTLAYSGEAFGTYAVLGTTVRSGKTAPSSIGSLSSGGCTASAPVVPPVKTTGTVFSVDTPFVDTGVVNTSVEAFVEPPADLTGTRSIAETYGVNMLGGVITADLIKSVSTTSHSTATGFTTSAAGTALVNLQVAGIPVAVSAPPNTVVALPGGLGSVIINEQTVIEGVNGASLVVIGLHVFIAQTDPVLGIQAGDQIIVSYARSAVKVFKEGAPTPRRVSGVTYGTQANGKTTLTSPPSSFRSDPTARLSLPCLGTDGDVRHNQVVDVYVPNGATTVIGAETVHTTAVALVTSLSAETSLSAKTEGLILLDGLITADLVKAEVHCFDDLSTVACDDGDSGLVHLVVDGQEVVVSAPNTVINLGFATVFLHRIITGPRAIEVRMIEVIITDQNPYGLAVNSVIQVSVARTSIAPA